MKEEGILYLIPNVLADNTAQSVISPQVREVVKHTTHYLVENPRSARRYISSLKLDLSIPSLQMETLDKNSTEHQIKELLGPAFKGHDMGIISEAGCPGIADPGALAVASAHANGLRVVPLPGPSSIFLALMASGFNGQSFTFLGYLPIEKKARIEAIKQMEKDSLRNTRTQIFMETPFRNNQLLEDLKNTLHPGTLLCVAKDITGAGEYIRSRTVAEWKKTKVDLHKVPTIFLVYAA